MGRLRIAQTKMKTASVNKRRKGIQNQPPVR
jgi:hypothetical protein